MKMQNNDEENKESQKDKPKGEFKLLLILFVMGVAWLIESFGSDGIVQGVSNGPGSIAQLTAVILVMLVVKQGFGLWRQGYRDGVWADVRSYLFGRKVVMMIAAILLYGLAVERLTFVPAGIVFCTAMMYVLDRKDFWKKLMISVFFIGIVYVIFSWVFKVILP